MLLGILLLFSYFGVGIIKSFIIGECVVSHLIIEMHLKIKVIGCQECWTSNT